MAVGGTRPPHCGGSGWTSQPTTSAGLSTIDQLQIRQTTETKQKSSFTEIRDQEEERANSYSSSR